MPSISTRTIVYKGLLLATQVGSFYPDLSNPLCVSALGLVHQRFRPTPFQLEAGASVPLHRA
jgi:glutamate synthase (NADPH/NADH) large chain